MNKVSIIVMVIGVIIMIAGIALIFTGDSFEENIEEGIIYEGADGDITIDQVNPDSESKYYVHLIDVKYVGGGTGGYNEAHGNSTWNLTEADCDKVKAFSIKDNGDNEMFYPKCNYVEDGTKDNYIVVGHLCTTINGEYTDDEGTVGAKWTGEGCRSGTYTWETNGNVIMVYDVDALVDAFFEIIAKGFGSFAACCCGVVVLIIGIILAFSLQDDDTSQYYQQNKEVGSTTSGAKGWDEQTDYIRKEKKEEDIPEKSEMATSESEENKEKKKRSGEYELPPPPEI
tara:strand:+ start:633 stop:1487 length:855 start_codon:yes stop_codon:yes gene_type:complete